MKIDEIEAFISEKFGGLLEAVDLSKYATQIAKMTDNNDHKGTFLLSANILGDKKILEIVKSINVIHEYEQGMPIHEYKYKIQSKINTLGRKKFGDDWDKYIYSNM